MRLKIALFLMLFCIIGAPAFGFEKMIERHCKELKVPKELALAIARQESGLNPLCINIAGQDFKPASLEEAQELIKKAAAADLSYDVGLMQINSQWIKKWSLDPLSLLDADTNIGIGIRILKEEIDRFGPNWKAVGAYHSPNPARALRYASQVYRHVKGKKGMLRPGLQMLVDKGIITRAQALTMIANPRLQGSKRKFIKPYKSRFSGNNPDSELARYQRQRKSHVDAQ